MKCEKCNEEHNGEYGSGRFCGPKCARSFATSKDKEETKIVKCITCGEKIIVNKRASNTLCKCDNCRKRKKIVTKKKYKNCLNCGKEFTKKKRYCDYKCQNEYEYKMYIKEWKNGKIDGSTSGGFYVSYNIRKYLWEINNNSCSRCGWNTPNPVTGKPILEIEHIDGNHKNNSPENLDLICPNCHSLTTTYKALNKGNAGDRHIYTGHKKK